MQLNSTVRSWSNVSIVYVRVESLVVLEITESIVLRALSRS